MGSLDTFETGAGGDGCDRDRRLRGLIGYSLKRAYHLIQADAVRVLEPYGLRVSTFSALAVIRDTPELSQSQLAEVLSIERSNAVVVVDSLEQAGLVERTRVPTDRRSYALVATAEGRRVCDAATAALREHEDRLTDGLPGEDLTRLIITLRRIEAQAQEETR